MGMRDHIPGVASKRRIGDPGRTSERRQAKSLGARLRPASGAMTSAKGDMVLPDFLVEAKSTTADQIAVKYDWLGKISLEAMQDRKAPALSVTFIHENGRPVEFGEWVLIPKRVFRELTERD